MPVPKRKTSKSRRDKRSANKFITMHSGAQCQTCQAPVASHAPCAACGYYKGLKVLRTKADRASGRVARQQAAHVARSAESAAPQAE